MKYKSTIPFAAAFLFLHGLATTTTAQTKDKSTFNIGLVPPLSTNGTHATQRANFLSLNAIAGVSRAETGATIAGFANIVLDHASGAQIAGFMNTTKNSSNGAQIAGFMNKAGDANVQVAGFLNIARKVKGVQIAGFINIADSSDCPIGLINIIKNGEKSVSLSIDETRTVLLSFRSGGRKLYGILGIGYNDRTHTLQSIQAGNGNLKLATAEAGIGAHWNLTDAFRVNTELAAITGTDFEHGDYQKDVFRLLPSLHFQHFEVFAGPTFNYVSSEKGLGADLIKHYTWSKNAGAKDFQALYFGAIAGLSYRF
ncbi:MAG TPA: hypothetical protein VHE34_09945 [Puia sp.]|uniref:hypothetical protein n=1 Tax=Puia sp. TaxID=2045100 RepID=UPI002BBAB4A2|nr:hypothetical protein [Puia sp.]HVU95537.1 hypothetical protein [Puia sp.]